MTEQNLNLEQSLSKLGLNEKQVKETIKNEKLSKTLFLVVHSINHRLNLDKEGAKVERLVGTLLYSLATISTKSDTLDDDSVCYVAHAIVDGRLKTSAQVDAAVAYCESRSPAQTQIDSVLFDHAAGVGVTVTKEEINALVASFIESNLKTMEEQRYKYLPTTLAAIRTNPALKWANMADLKPVVDALFLERLGPKDERDAPQKKTKTDTHQYHPTVKKEDKKKVGDTEVGGTNGGTMFTQGFLGALHKPGGNPQLTPALREAHMKATAGRVITRFPPEPNGYLHIGHSKAITVNFGYARHHDGICYLRFDDTNPEKEEEKYFTSIEAMVSWLGFTPYKVSYSSDYFGRLYECAEDLIKRGKAYVCKCSDEVVKANRGGEDRGPRKACEHRSQSPDDALREFRDMRDGKYKPKSATLRMKQDLDDGNPQMWDLVAYRVLYASHHRTKDEWKIYPTYDFTHCLVDSFENITHSLCTTEFVQSRVSYEWLCDALELYKPAQREYGRLNLQGTIMSKRKIEKLVTEGHVRDWNDPRIYTLVALRRRGVPPGAILSFVNELGVTTSTTNIQTVRFDNNIRNYLENSVPRLMLIPDPVKVILDNVADEFLELCSVPFSPKDASMGEHVVPLTKIVYIDRSDFRAVDSQDYFRLAPGKSVGLLKAAHTIRATSFEIDSLTNRITTIHATYENDIPFKKPKTYIQWVSESSEFESPIEIKELRQFKQLFRSDNPGDHPAGFLGDIAPDSEEVIRGAMMEIGFKEVKRRAPWPKVAGEEGGKDEVGAPESIRFQGLRVGYFCVDSDSTEDQIILNRIVTLKEDTAKN